LSLKKAVPPQESTSASSLLPLQGIRVVSMEHALAGPVCSRNLADLGAQVIKIERPGEGDFSRGYDQFVYGQSTYFVWLNRTKKSLGIDLKKKDAQDVMHRLMAHTDVLIQNLAPGVSKRMHLDYETLKKINPQIIVADITGYGEGGPLSGKKAYDMLIQAEAGVMSINGTPETPARVGLSLVDMATGMYTQNAVLAALFRRAQTGLGAHLQIAMFDAMAEWMMYPMYRYAYNGTIVPRNAMNNPNIAPYGGHATRDGIVIFSIQNEREWQFFCEITLGQPLLCNHKDYENNSMRIIHADALTQLIESHFSDKSTAEVVGLLDAAGIANGRLNDAKDLWNHPQLSARDKWREVTLPNQEKIRAVLPPAIFSDVEAQMGPVPELGEHTESILKELKYDEKQINELFKSGAVSGHRIKDGDA